MKQKYGGGRVLRMLMLFCAAGLILSAVLLLRSSREYAVGDAAYVQVRQAARAETVPTDAPAQTDGETPAETSGTLAEDDVDFSALTALNPDTAAWLTSPDGQIDYPVVRGSDNDYYLDHLFTGEHNKLGTIFMDCRNASDFSDRNTVLYGHNMKDGSMFAGLTRYQDQSYYDRYPAMTLRTPAGDYTVEFFAGVTLDGSTDAVLRAFADDDAFLDYVAQLRAASTFTSDTAVTAGDRLVTLCTCSYVFTNARYALFGRLTPAD